MHVHLLTLFPGMFPGTLEYSIMGRAIENGILTLHAVDLRDFTHDPHRTADDYQFGGGPGMVMKPEPVFEAVEAIFKRFPEDQIADIPIILMSPQGVRLSQVLAQKLAARSRMVILCGHYQGIDDRVREHLVTHEVSIGDYVVSGGELPAMVLIDAVTRLLPGVVGSPGSIEQDSITSGLLQHPLYTRPQTYREWSVPDVLLSGNHQEVARWRRQQALLQTLALRPDLLETAALSRDDRVFLDRHGYRAKS